ncbi:hypothetical protein FS842_006080 [Serendipita sp. 407]|nr:hypothetical protein FS842_006080 [Serendipita sp. 407]
MLLYICTHYDKDKKFLVSEPNDVADMNTWLFFQASHQGPFFGQLQWFSLYHEEQIPSAVKRYTDETLRILGVLDSVLKDREWLVGNKCTLADIAFVKCNEYATRDLLGDQFNFREEFPHVYRWHRTLMARPAVAWVFKYKAKQDCESKRWSSPLPHLMHNPPQRVLITNDDGPPSKDSPYVFGLYKALKELGWNVIVVLPSSQKSWIGKAFQIHEVITGRYYYPCEPDGMGETSESRRPLKEGEVGEWILLDATPATCTNIALHNLFPGQIDLVLSGPNYGRNTSAAFALSSGTVGAAMSGALSRVRSIALSYGNFQYPPPEELISPAHELSMRIIQALWGDWGRDEDSEALSTFVLEHMDHEKDRTQLLTQTRGLRDGEVDLYAINIPILPALIQEGGMKVVWTRQWRNEYGRLFKRGDREPKGVGAIEEEQKLVQNSEEDELVFSFSPEWKGLLSPDKGALPYGTDAWGIHHDMTTVTPLKATFGEPSAGSMGLGSEHSELVNSRWSRGGRPFVLDGR